MEIDTAHVQTRGGNSVFRPALKYGRGRNIYVSICSSIRKIYARCGNSSLEAALRRRRNMFDIERLTLRREGGYRTFYAIEISAPFRRTQFRALKRREVQNHPVVFRWPILNLATTAIRNCAPTSRRRIHGSCPAPIQNHMPISRPYYAAMSGHPTPSIVGYSNVIG